MDLLLYLIRKNEVDVYDIPIALIVTQYMEYLDLMRGLNLDVAGDFLVMAATLSHVKSLMLLPPEEVDGEEEEEGVDPRAELVSRPVLGRDVFTRPPSTELMLEAAEAAGIETTTFAEIGVFELLTAFQDVVERSGVGSLHEISMERVSMIDRLNYLVSLLREVDSISFDQLFTEATSRVAIITTFLAVLELIRLKVVKAYQDKSFGSISLVRAAPIDDEWLSDNLPGMEEEG